MQYQIKNYLFSSYSYNQSLHTFYEKLAVISSKNSHEKYSWGLYANFRRITRIIYLWNKLKRYNLIKLERSLSKLCFSRNFVFAFGKVSTLNLNNVNFFQKKTDKMVGEAFAELIKRYEYLRWFQKKVKNSWAQI